jgi:hypothetical protein
MKGASIWAGMKGRLAVDGTPDERLLIASAITCITRDESAELSWDGNQRPASMSVATSPTAWSSTQRASCNGKGRAAARLPVVASRPSGRQGSVGSDADSRAYRGRRQLSSLGARSLVPPAPGTIRPEGRCFRVGRRRRSDTYPTRN